MTNESATTEASALKPTVFLQVKVDHDSEMRHVATIRNGEFWSWLTRQGKPDAGHDDGADNFADREFTVISDEPAALGGTDSYPSPLEYFLAGVGFCLVTQVLRYAKRMRVQVDAVKIAMDASWGQEGSFWAGTMMSRVTAMSTAIEISSDASAETIAALIHNAKAGCFAEAALRDPVDVATAVTLNGAALDIDKFPKQPKRGGA